MFKIYSSKPIIFSDFSEYVYSSQGAKSKILMHYGRCTGPFLGVSHGNTPVALTTNKNVNLSSFKSSKNIQKKEGVSDRSVFFFRIFLLISKDQK